MVISLGLTSPVDNNGDNSTPAPFDLFQASIGTFAGIYIKSFCDRRQIPTDGIKIIQTMEFNEEKKVPSVFKLDIQLPAEFPDKFRDAVINAADWYRTAEATVISMKHMIMRVILVGTITINNEY